MFLDKLFETVIYFFLLTHDMLHQIEVPQMKDRYGRDRRVRAVVLLPSHPLVGPPNRTVERFLFAFFTYDDRKNFVLL